MRASAGEKLNESLFHLDNLLNLYSERSAAFYKPVWAERFECCFICFWRGVSLISLLLCIRYTFVHLF